LEEEKYREGEFVRGNDEEVFIGSSVRFGILVGRFWALSETSGQ